MFFDVYLIIFDIMYFLFFIYFFKVFNTVYFDVYFIYVILLVFFIGKIIREKCRDTETSTNSPNSTLTQTTPLAQLNLSTHPLLPRAPYN